VYVLRRVTDFFLGLNAGQWLRIRIGQIADGAAQWLETQADRPSWSASDLNANTKSTDDQVQDKGDSHAALGEGLAALYKHTVLLCGATDEAPPEDKAYLFQYYCLSGNGGVSGQVTWEHDGDSKEG
jgi:hypothetical protein